ncbi:DMT family transporter [Ectobacillus sp. sgz5001026]|uniref:DMT family transporter n=1 Tax=Ectobacillus sp. sgz5001026 TaxID=3242473 RepID=UPI0036D2098A
MNWVALILAGCFEVVGVLGVTLINRNPSIRSFLILIGGFSLSFVFLYISMENISMGTAYAVWTGIGTVGATLVGMLFFGESRNTTRIFFILLVIMSVLGLKFVN